jgi:hypothetical protein
MSADTAAVLVESSPMCSAAIGSFTVGGDECKSACRCERGVYSPLKTGVDIDAVGRGQSLYNNYVFATYSSDIRSLFLGDVGRRRAL